MKKGFTLTELLGVLAIIGILSLLIVPITINIIKKQKEKQYEQQIENIELAAKNFGSDNLVILPTEEREYIYINIGQLKSMGYLEEKIINTITDTEISNCARIKITKVGSAHTYLYQKETENILECDLENGGVIISAPTNSYIRKDEITSYIVTINEQLNEEVVVKYDINKNKIHLTGNTDAIYTVVEGKGVYKVIIKGGSVEGILNLRLDSKAIVKDEIHDLIGTEGVESLESVIIDNTEPEIVFGTNGSNWVKKASSTITVTDNLSGGTKNSYKYIYTKDYNIDVPNAKFESGESYSVSNVTGDYYLLASACDRSGNCTIKTSNVFKLDNTAPTITFGKDGNNSWSKTASSTISVSDSNSGGDNTTYKYIYSTNTTSTPTTLFSNGASYSQNSGSGDYYLIASACDTVGNCATKTSNAFKLDNTVPTITFGTNGNSSWSKTASSSITVTDDHSQGDTATYKYIYSASSGTPNNSFTSGSSYSQTSGSGDYYLRASACDNVGNCTTETSNVFKLDNTKPTISYGTCTPVTNYTKCLKVYMSDDYSQDFILYRSHCANYTSNNTDSCDRANATDRLNYFYNNYSNGRLAWLPLGNNENDDKSWYSTHNAKYFYADLHTSYYVPISFALKLCDSAGNCTDGTYYQVK